MKLLLAFAIVINSYAIVNEFQTGPLANQETFTILRTGLQPFKVFPSSSDERFRRNPPGDQLKDSIDKLKTISRLTNVIYLQQGISNGSVFKTDELISELLHFGPVKPKDIQTLDFNKIKTAFDVVKELPSKLKKNDYLEKAFSTIGTVQKNINGFSEIKKWDGKDDFAADLKKIENEEVDFSLVADLQKHLTNWKSSYSQVLTLVEKNSFIQADIAFIALLGSASSELKTMIKKLQEKKSFFDFSNGGKAVNAIESLVKISFSVETLRANISMPPEREYSSFDNNAKQIEEAVKQMSDVLPNLEVVRNVFSSQLYPQLYTSTDYAHGLPDGYDDVGKVTTAFNNAWLKNIVQNGSLDKSYPSVQSLTSSISPIQKHLRASKKEVLESLFSVMKESKGLDIFNGLPEGKVRSVADCFKKTKRDAPSLIVENLKKSAENIDEELENLQKLLKNAATILKDEENNLESLSQLLAKAKQDDVSTFGPTLQNFSKFDASSKMSTALAKINPQNINGDKLKALATTAAANLGKVDDYEKNAAEYYASLKCLLDEKDASKVIDAVKKSKDLRQPPSDHAKKYKEGLQAVENVVKTKTGLSDLRKTIDEAKGKTTLESSLLNLLEQADVHSKNLGLATRGAANMKTLIDEKAQFAIFEAQSNLVETEAKKHSNEFNQDESKLLNELVALGDSIKTMYDGLTSWEAGIAAVDTSNLENYSELFTTIKNVNELPVDLRKMTQTLQNLIDSVEAEDQKSPSIESLRTVEKALIDLDGLHFSNYVANSDKVHESLSALSSFFIEYAKAEVTRRSATPSPQILIVTQDSGAAIAEVEEKENAKNTQIGIYVAVGVVCVLLLVAVILCIYCCCGKDPDDIDGVAEETEPPLEVRVSYMRKFGTLVVAQTKDHEEEIAQLLPDLEKKHEAIKEAERAALKTCPVVPAPVEAKDRKTAAGDEEETDRTSSSFLEELRNAQDVDPEVSESSDDGDNEVRNMAGGNKEEVEDNSAPGFVDPKASELSEDGEVREMAGGKNEGDEDNSDQEVRLLAGGNKKKNNAASVNLTIKKDAVKTPAKSKEPTTPKTLEGPKPEAKSKASADPNASADPKEAVDNKASTGEKEASATPKLPEKINAPSTSPAAVNKVELDTLDVDIDLLPPEPVPAPIQKPEEQDLLDDEFASKVPKVDQGSKSDARLAAEMEYWSKFQYKQVDKGMNESRTPEDANKIVKRHKKDCREEVWLNEDNRIKLPTWMTKMTKKRRGKKFKKGGGRTFKNGFFHGNIARFRNGRKIIACQGPKVGAEGGKEPTVEKFYYVAKVHGVRAVLMLCNFKEPVKQNDGSVKMKTKCDVYFPLEENDDTNFTGYTVKCVKKTVDGDLVTRELMVTYDGEEPFPLTHYQYLGWPDKSSPRDPYQYACVWATLRKLNEPLIIHCSAGIGRTGTALLVEEIYQHIFYSDGTSTGTGMIDFGAAFRNVRKYRARAVQSANQFLFAVMVVFELLFANVKHDQNYQNPAPEPTPGMERICMDDFQLFLKYRRVWELLRPDPPPQVTEQKEGKAADGEKSKEEKVDAKKSTVKVADGQKSKETPVDVKKSVVKSTDGGKSKVKTVDAVKSTVKEPTGGKKK